MHFQHLQLPAAAVLRHLEVGVPLDPAAAAALGSAHRPCVVDQDLPHRAGHHRQKMCPIGEFGRRSIEQLYEGFVDQSRWLERMTGRLAAKKRLRDTAQLPIDERHQLVESGIFSLAQPIQENCDPRRRPLGTVPHIL